jgi:hypothetical protein
MNQLKLYSERVKSTAITVDDLIMNGETSDIEEVRERGEREGEKERQRGRERERESKGGERRKGMNQLKLYSERVKSTAITVDDLIMNGETSDIEEVRERGEREGETERERERGRERVKGERRKGMNQLKLYSERVKSTAITVDDLIMNGETSDIEEVREREREGEGERRREKEGERE